MKMKFPRAAFKRTIGEDDGADFNQDDIVLLKKEQNNFLCDVHESVIQAIHSHLPWGDLCALKCSCALFSQLVEDMDIIRRLVSDEGLNTAFMICLYENRHRFVSMMINSYKIDKTILENGLIYSVARGFNESAVALLNLLNVQMRSSIDVFEFDVDHSVFCKNYCCFVEYMTLSIGMLSLRLLLQVACNTNNTFIVDHLVSRYQLQFANIDIWTTLKHLSYSVMEYMINSSPDFKIKQQMMTAYIRSYDVYPRASMIEYLLIKNKIKLTNQLISTLVDYMTQFTADSYAEILNVVYLIDRYGTSRQVQNAFSQCIAKHLPLSIKAFIEHSKRIVYDDKYISMIESDEFWSANYSKYEYILVSKLRMQERKVQDLHSNDIDYAWNF